ncbi:putative UNC-45/Cro1/She4 central domain-containing protein [Seiridium cardinale]|uniref:UNC-45/Cro1/She4 central domain-containing protein n=1 Tax=Seiridium cardinale TaxID=138064 RepID=A0ABR2XWM1_9PEZI
MSNSPAPGGAADNPDTIGAMETTIVSNQPIMAPQEVEELFQSGKQREQLRRITSSEDEEDDEVVLSDDEQSWRVEKLRRVLNTLRNLLDSGSTELDGIAQKIGDGSREGKSCISGEPSHFPLSAQCFQPRLPQFMEPFSTSPASNPRSAQINLAAPRLRDQNTLTLHAASWRLSLGQSDVLEFFLSLIGKDGLRQAITVHALRVIGNSCADTDENRARVVASNCMPKIVNFLNNDSTLLFAIPVLFNVCVDYAQVAAYKAGINPELVSLISSPRITSVEAFMSIICKLLALVASQEPEANFVHPATPFVLFTLATSPRSLANLEEFLGQTSVALTYLSNQSFQDAFLEAPDSIPLFLKAFSKACANFELDVADPDEAAELKKVKSVFTQAMADISANPLFASACPIDGAEIQALQEWIGSPYVELQSAACLALGNIARSDEVCTALVQQSAIHRPLVVILSNPSNTDAQLLHSTLSFLKNLAIPASNKTPLGEAGLFEPLVLPRLWGLDAQIQVQFTAVSLTRLLLVSSPENVKRICAPLSADPSSPASERTQLNSVVGLFLRSDQEPTKTEAARAVAAVLRVLHSSPDVAALLPAPSASSSGVSSPESFAPSALESFYANHDTLPNALIFLGSQQKFPVLRSDLWFVMALMSRSPPGAEVVATCLQNIELLRVLLQTVTGRDMLAGREVEIVAAGGAPHGSTAIGNSHTQDLVAGSVQDETGVPGIPGGLEPQQVDPAKKAGMARVDRENGLVLIAELLRRCPDKLSVLPLETFQEILKTGGEQVLSDREGKADTAGLQ